MNKIIIVALIAFYGISFSQEGFHTVHDSLPPFTIPGYSIIVESSAGDTSHQFSTTTRWLKYFTESKDATLVVPGEDVCAAIAKLNDNSMILFDAGVHNVDAKCVITENNVRILGYGSSTIFKPITTIDTLFAINNADSIQIGGFTIQASNDISVPIKFENTDFGIIHDIRIDSASANGIRLQGVPGSKNNLLSKVIVRNSSNDGYVLLTSDNNVFIQCVGLFNSDGVNLVQSDECTFIGCDFSSNSANGMKLESPATPIYGVRISNNRIASNNQHGILLVNSKYTMIENNLIKESSTSPANTYDGVNVDGSDNNVIAGNMFYDYKDSHTDFTRFAVSFNATSDTNLVAGNYFQQGMGNINDAGGLNKYPWNFYGSRSDFTLRNLEHIYFGELNSNDYLVWNETSAQLALIFGGTQIFDWDASKVRTHLPFELDESDPTLADYQIAVKPDHWGTNRDAIKFKDGTQAVMVPAVKESDTWNTNDVIAIQADGSFELVAPTGGGSITVEEVDGTPSVSDVSTIQFDQTDGLTVTDEGGGTARIDFSSGSGSVSDYILGGLSTHQNTDLSSGDHIKYDDVISSSGSSISLNDTSSYSTTNDAASVGRFTVNTTAFYEIRALTLGEFSGSGFMTFQLYNATTGMAVTNSIQGAIFPMDATEDYSNMPEAYHRGELTSGTKYEIRITNNPPLTLIDQNNTVILFQAVPLAGGGGSFNLTVKEQDSSPSVSNVNEIRVTNATLTDEGSGAVSISTGGGGGSLTVEEADASPTVSSVSTIQFDQTDGFTVTDESGGQVQIDLVNASDAAVSDAITLTNITQITNRDHGSLTGLTDDDHSVYALLAGRSSGQVLIGGSSSGDDLTLRSTSNATKGDILLVDDGGNVIIGGAATASRLRVFEPSGSGTNYTEFVSQAQSANITYTLPIDDGTSGYVLHTDGDGNLSWDTDDGAGGGAPIDATYITQIANGTLTNEQAVGALATGIMTSTTTTGVIATRTLTGTPYQIAIANGDGSSNPTFSFPYTATLASDPTLSSGQQVFGTNGIIFEGATANSIEGLLTSVDVATADKTWTLPDLTGTITLTTNNLSVFSATTSAQLYGIISDESGSAGVVPRFSLSGAAQGDIIYYNGSNWVNLGPGTNGQVLHTQGAGANPIWDADDGAGGGAPVDATYITQTANGSLTNEQAVGALATGVMASTTTTGVIATRVLTGTAGAVSISNGDGSANPTFTLPSAITVPTSYLIGSDPADAGVIRLENAAVIGWEASPAGTDITLTVNSSEVLTSSGTFNAPTLTEGGNAVPNSTNNLSFFSATTSAQLYGVLSDESGAAGVVPRFSLSGAAQGDIIYYNGSNWVNLAPGISGQVLHTQGAGVNPIWDSDDGAGGGAPVDAAYVVVSLNGTLTSERQIVAGTYLDSNDGGENGSYTLSMDPTEINDATFGDNTEATIAWTFDPTGTTSPVFSISDGVINVSTGTLQQGGTDVVIETRTINTTAPIQGGGDLSSNRTFSLNQNAGTDVTADLEEETHAGEHQNSGPDEINVTNLSGRLSESQNVSVYTGGSFQGIGYELDFIAGNYLDISASDAGVQVDVTYSFDPTEVGSVTWGTADATWTFDATSGTNPQVGWTDRAIVLEDIGADLSTRLRIEEASDNFEIYVQGTQHRMIFDGNPSSGNSTFWFVNNGSGNGLMDLQGLDFSNVNLSTSTTTDHDHVNALSLTLSTDLAEQYGGTGVSSLSNVLGTTNQINVSGGTSRVIGGNVTISLPQDFHTGANVMFNQVVSNKFAVDANEVYEMEGASGDTEMGYNTSVIFFNFNGSTVLDLSSTDVGINGVPLHLWSSATPATGTVAGRVVFDTDLLGASVGAAKLYDGTRVTAVTAYAESDLPANGNYLKYNASTDIWETVQPAASDLSDGVTGTGSIVKRTDAIIDDPLLTLDGLASTSEGRIAWNSTSDYITVGTGSVARRFRSTHGMVVSDELDMTNTSDETFVITASKAMELLAMKVVWTSALNQDVGALNIRVGRYTNTGTLSSTYFADYEIPTSASKGASATISLGGSVDLPSGYSIYLSLNGSAYLGGTAKLSFELSED